MRYSVRNVEREFTPAEAAKITGVSTALQRDWRRRGILSARPDSQWTRWGLIDLINLSVRKLFSDAGMDVSKTGVIATMAVLPTLTALHSTPGAIAIEGDELPDSEIEALLDRSAPRTTHPEHTAGRFLAIYGDQDWQVSRADELEQFKTIFDQNPDRPILPVVDCRNLAALIVKRAGPVIYYEIEANDE